MTDDLLGLLPELCVTATLLVVLLAGAQRAPKATRPSVLVGLSVVGLVVALAAMGRESHESVSVFSGMIALDGLALFFRGLFLVVAIAGVVVGGLSREVDRQRLGEYLVMLLSITLGMMLLGAAQHLLMVYLALELVSLPSYVLAGFRRGNRESSEAALKYVVYGGVASGLMLYGFSLIYGLTGRLELGEVAKALGAIGSWNMATRVLLVLAGALSFSGFAYKMAAVPFHMWCPDVYQGAPTPFVAFLSVAPKAAGVAALIRFIVIGFGVHGVTDTAVAEQLPWGLVLGLVAVATITLGTLVAIPQDNLKRLLAYSSIAHAGYVLMGVAVASEPAMRAVMFYMAVYFVMNFGAFFAVMVVRDATGREAIGAYRGLGGTSPVLAAGFAILLFSLTGLPPFAGFIAKYYLLAALLETKSSLFYAVALAAVLNSAISLYFYARVVKAMYLEKPEEGERPVPRLGPASATVLAAFVAPTLVLGVWWTPLVETIRKMSTILR